MAMKINMAGNMKQESPSPDDFLNLYRILQSHHRFSRGWPDGDWPVTGRFNPPRFEVILGAILTQNTRWENVEMVLETMSATGLTTAGEIRKSGRSALEQAVRSSGFFRQKAAVLDNLCRLWESNGGIPSRDIDRKELISIPGIGPETADSILLYVLYRTEFIADSYTRRLVERLGWYAPSPGYDACKKLFEDNLPPETELFRKYHALIVLHARRFCRKKPLCDSCPLASAGICRFPEIR